MAIERKELMEAPRFEGIGSFVYCRPGNDEWKPSYVMEFYGGQISVEVEDLEVSNPPVPGTMFLIGGRIRHNSRNATVSLVTETKKQLAVTWQDLTSEQMDIFVRGLRIWGVGNVHSKDSFTSTGPSRQTYLKTTLRWHGSTHEFKKLSPEVYQRLPAPGKYIRFELGISVREERNRDGQMVVLQFPSLASVTVDELATGSVPSAAATAAAGTPPKPPIPPAKAS